MNFLNVCFLNWQLIVFWVRVSVKLTDNSGLLAFSSLSSLFSLNCESHTIGATMATAGRRSKTYLQLRKKRARCFWKNEMNLFRSAKNLWLRKFVGSPEGGWVFALRMGISFVFFCLQLKSRGVFEEGTWEKSLR